MKINQLSQKQSLTSLLGIHTTRAATLVVSDDEVVRDQFYDGHPRKEKVAVVLRLAPSWFRFGTFEILAFSREADLLRSLTDFTIKYYFPSIDMYDSNKYLAFFNEVVSQTAKLVASWQSVGFTHGVGNTDNFSILSLTLDYGPFRFLDQYDPDMIPNTSDDERRYSYKNQPNVGKYNLEKLRSALSLLFNSQQNEQSFIILQSYEYVYKKEFLTFFRRKLGLSDAHEEDEVLIKLLLQMMAEISSDFTMTWQNLSNVSLDAVEHGITKNNDELWALVNLSSHSLFSNWISLYKTRLKHAGISEEMRRSIMQSANPRYVLRNWIAEKVIESVEHNNFTLLHKVAHILSNPFTIQPDAEALGFANKPPFWADAIKVSCSS